MNRKQLLTTGLAACIAAGCLALVADGLPGGPVVAGEYIWLRTPGAQNDARQAICDEQSAGDDCVELCMILNNSSVLQMGMFCCVDPSSVGGWDGPEECNLPVS